MGKLLTVAEVAARLTYSEWQIYEMCKRRILPHVRLGDRRIAIPETELDKWIEERLVLPSSTPASTPPADRR